jgi:hypothetical protein
MTGTCHHAQFFPLKWSLEKFWPGWPGTKILTISVSFVPLDDRWEGCYLDLGHYGEYRSVKSVSLVERKPETMMWHPNSGKLLSKIFLVNGKLVLSARMCRVL